METIKNYINGELVAPVSRQYLDNYDPAIGQVYAQTPDSDERDVAAAVAAAEQAFPGWSTTPAGERSAILLRISDLIQKRLEALALAESVDTGKPVSLAKSVDIPRAASNFRFFGSADEPQTVSEYSGTVQLSCQRSVKRDKNTNRKRIYQRGLVLAKKGLEKI